MKKKVVLTLFSLLIIAAVLVFVWRIYFDVRQNIPTIDIETRFVLDAEEGLNTPKVGISSSAEEFAETEIDLVELKRLKEDLVKADAEAASGEAAAWVRLDGYDLPEDLFNVCYEDLGYFESNYNLRAGFSPTIREYDCQKGTIIGVTNVSNYNLKAVLGNAPQRKSYISIVECLGLTGKGFPQPFVFLQLTNKEVFTVIFHPDQDAVKLETKESGLDVEKVNMGIGLRNKEFFRSNRVHIIVPLHSDRNIGTYLGGDTSVKGYNNITEALNKEVITKWGRLKGSGRPHITASKFFGVSTKEESKKEDSIRLVGTRERILLSGQRDGNNYAPVDMFLEFSFSPEI